MQLERYYVTGRKPRQNFTLWYLVLILLCIVVYIALNPHIKIEFPSNTKNAPQEYIINYPENEDKVTYDIKINDEFPQLTRLIGTLLFEIWHIRDMIVILGADGKPWAEFSDWSIPFHISVTQTRTKDWTLYRIKTSEGTIKVKQPTQPIDEYETISAFETVKITKTIKKNRLKNFIEKNLLQQK